jgi:hypothetical protein
MGFPKGEFYSSTTERDNTIVLAQPIYPFDQTSNTFHESAGRSFGRQSLNCVHTVYINIVHFPFTVKITPAAKASVKLMVGPSTGGQTKQSHMSLTLTTTVSMFINEIYEHTEDTQRFRDIRLSREKNHTYKKGKQYRYRYRIFQRYSTFYEKNPVIEHFEYIRPFTIKLQHYKDYRPFMKTEKIPNISERYPTAYEKKPTHTKRVNSKHFKYIRPFTIRLQHYKDNRKFMNRPSNSKNELGRTTTDGRPLDKNIPFTFQRITK